MVDTKEISLAVLRFVLGGVFVYFGLSQIFNPELWNRLVPGFLAGIGSTLVVMISGGILIVFGLLLFMGLLTKVASLFLTVDLVFFALLSRFSPNAVRDLGLAFAALLFFFHGPGYYSVSEWRKRRKEYKARLAHLNAESGASTPENKEGEKPTGETHDLGDSTEVKEGEKPAGEAHELGDSTEDKEGEKPAQEKKPAEGEAKPAEGEKTAEVDGEKKEEAPTEKENEAAAEKKDEVSSDKKDEPLGENKDDASLKKKDKGATGTVSGSVVSATQKSEGNNLKETSPDAEKKLAQGKTEPAGSKKPEAKDTVNTPKNDAKSGDSKNEKKKESDKKPAPKKSSKKTVLQKTSDKTIVRKNVPKKTVAQKTSDTKAVKKVATKKAVSQKTSANKVVKKVASKKAVSQKKAVTKKKK